MLGIVVPREASLGRREGAMVGVRWLILRRAEASRDAGLWE